MKKIIFCMMALIVTTTFYSFDQDLRRQKKINPNKEAKDQAKSYQKNGYEVEMGSLSMETTLRDYFYNYKLAKEGEFAKYITIQREARGGSKNSAKSAALAFARNELAQDLGTKIIGITKTSLSNLDAGDVSNFEKVVESGQNRFSAELIGVQTVYCFYKEETGGGYSAAVALAYSFENAKRMAKKVILEKLESENEELHDKIDNLFGDSSFDNELSNSFLNNN
ncbi:MAG: hypothetical protein JXQ87_11305 [Bacteroidia bacterium]